MNSLNFALMMIKSPHNTFKRYTELPTAGRKKTHQMAHRVPESSKSNLDMGQVNIGSPSWLSRWFVIFPMENQLFGESIRNYFLGSLWANARLNWSSKITWKQLDLTDSSKIWLLHRLFWMRIFTNQQTTRYLRVARMLRHFVVCITTLDIVTQHRFFWDGSTTVGQFCAHP